VFASSHAGNVVASVGSDPRELDIHIREVDLSELEGFTSSGPRFRGCGF
jgi:hypothetical protein